MAISPISPGNALTSAPSPGNALVPADPRHRLPATRQESASRAVALPTASRLTGLAVAFATSGNLSVGGEAASFRVAIPTLPATENSAAYLRAAELGTAVAEPGTLLNILV